MRNDYDYQKEANISCLIEDVEYEERKDAFFTIMEEFEQVNIKYGLACSFNLFLRGIVDEFHDFDFIVDKQSIPVIKSTMEKLGAILVGAGGNGFCESDVYLHYQLGRVDIDIISGFRILTFGTQFLYEFNNKEIEFCSIYEEKTLNIPLISVEALYLLYCMMEGWQPRRRYKRILIGEYIEKEGIKFPNIFNESLKENLPGWVKRETRKFLLK